LHSAHEDGTKSQDVRVKWKSASIDVSRSSAAKPPRRSAAHPLSFRSVIDPQFGGDLPAA
jgi:hypothetical protein